MYDDYSFKLEWYDLDEELRDEKITQYLQSEYDNSDTQEDFDTYCESRYATAEKNIEAHFPIYF